jgi:hydrogenase/urease accessory protein HupE
MSSFLGGLLHPLAVPAHALALLALGLLIGQQGDRLMPQAAFVAGLVAGLIALALAVGATSAADVLLADAALTGLLVALGRPLPTFVSAPLAATAGIALGLDSPPEVISISAATVMLIGTGLGASLALAIVAAGASRLTRAWQRIGTRILGSWIAASAILVLALRYAREQLF